MNTGNNSNDKLLNDFIKFPLAALLFILINSSCRYMRTREVARGSDILSGRCKLSTVMCASLSSMQFVSSIGKKISLPLFS